MTARQDVDPRTYIGVHGTKTAWESGCRCAKCAEAYARAMRCGRTRQRNRDLKADIFLTDKLLEC